MVYSRIVHIRYGRRGVLPSHGGDDDVIEALHTEEGLSWSPVVGLSSRGSSWGFFDWRGSQWEETVDAMGERGDTGSAALKKVSGFKNKIAEAVSRW